MKPFTAVRVCVFLLTELLQECVVDGDVQMMGLESTATLPLDSPAGTVVRRFTVDTDPDSPLAPGFPSIVTTQPVSRAFSVSALSSNLFQVVWLGNPVLDWLNPPETAQLQIFAEDTAGNTDLRTLTVGFTSPSNALLCLGNQDEVIYLKEHESLSYQVSVYSSEPGSIQYYLMPSTVFKINSAGVIQSLKMFDFETDPHSYLLNVTVSAGGQNITGRIVVYIVNTDDKAPHFITTFGIIQIPEEQLPGTVVATVRAQDPDDFNYVGFLRYSINDTKYFAIDPYSGVIVVTVQMDRDKAPLRDEPLIYIKVSVQDFSPNISSKSNSTVIVFNVTDINDKPPVCSPGAYSVIIPETMANGSIVAKVNCTDDDVYPINKNFTFCLLSGLGSNDRFAMLSPVSPEIVVKGNLQYEAINNLAVGNQYSLLVVACDTAFPFFEGTASVYVTVQPAPGSLVFSQSSYHFNVSEMSGCGSKIGQVSVVDRNFPLANVLYSLDTPTKCTSIFWLNPGSGNLQVTTQPDYEVSQQCVFTVTAREMTPIGTLLSCHTTVTVNILPANVGKPNCTPIVQHLAVPLSQPIQTAVQGFTLTCQDRDSPPAALRYVISSGNVNNHFTLLPLEGSDTTALILGMPFDYSSGLDRVWEYKLVMHIIDDNLLEARRGPKGLVQTGTVTVYVRVYQPGLTIHTTTQEKVLYVTQKVDTYSSKAWYIFFVPVVGTLISLGLLIWVVKLRCCSSQLKPRPEPGDALHGRPRSIPLQTTYHFSSSTGPVPRSLGEVSLG